MADLKATEDIRLYMEDIQQVFFKRHFWRVASFSKHFSSENANFSKNKNRLLNDRRHEPVAKVYVCIVIK
jgi:hypothetical protein